MIGWFRKRFRTPIEERNYGMIYAVLAGLLFVGTLWAVYNEVEGRRPWKYYQQEFRDLKERVILTNGRVAREKYDREALDSLRHEITRVDSALATPALQEVQERIDRLNEQIRDKGQERANLKSEADNRNYLFEHASRLGHNKDAEEYRRQRTELEQEMATYDREIAALQAEQDALVKSKLGALQARRTDLEKQRDSIYSTVAGLKKKLDETSSMPITIRQVMLPNFDQSNFGPLQVRVDRCQTCHLGIGDPVMSDTTIFSQVGKGEIFRTKETANRARKVFGPHPNPEMLVTHNVERFGCTPCHGGQPSAVDDVDHAHGLQAHWERPLLAGAYVQGSCRKCHEGRYDYGEFQTISNGRKLFVDFGCFGCHEGPSIPDFKEYKVAPSLVNISAKVSPAWAVKWVMNPQAWSEHTRMPNFLLSEAESRAVVAYLWDRSSKHDWQPLVVSPPAGDAARGKQIIQDVGCIACHAIDGYTARGGFSYKPSDGLFTNLAVKGNRVAEGNSFAPDLNKVGSKVSAAWLYDWVRNPKHFSANSRMPDLRLSDAEAADVTAYLLTKRDGGTTGGPGGTIPGLGDAKAIAEGEQLIRRYGCFGCHAIDGMEEEEKVSVSLADFGSKTGADLYFGYLGELDLKAVRKHFKKVNMPFGDLYMHLENGEDWFTWTALKMKNSRVFATDAIPQMMPVFNMTDEEAYAMTVALRSYTKDYVPPTMTNTVGPVLQPAVDDGRFMIHWNNCVGCHRLEGEYGGFVLDILRKDMGLKGDDILPYGPPSLNTVGAKLQEPWFYGFVHDPSSRPVRTWLNIRMPTYHFSEGDISRLLKYFLGLEQETMQFTDYSYYPASAASIAGGRQMWDKLKCSQCHAAGSIPASGGETAVPAPNLALASDRIRPEWIIRWVRDPQLVVKGTKMPNFFGTWDEPAPADPIILGGDWQKQITALRDYVWRIGGAKAMVRGGAAMSATSGAPAIIPQPVTPTDTSERVSQLNGVPKASRKLSMR